MIDCLILEKPPNIKLKQSLYTSFNFRDNRISSFLFDLAYVKISYKDTQVKKSDATKYFNKIDIIL